METQEKKQLASQICNKFWCWKNVLSQSNFIALRHVEFEKQDTTLRSNVDRMFLAFLKACQKCEAGYGDPSEKTAGLSN